MRISDWCSDVCSSDLERMTAIRLDSEDTIEAPSPATRPSDCIARAFTLPNSTPLQQKARKQSVMKETNGGTPSKAMAVPRTEAVNTTRPRTEARRVGKECVRTGRARGRPKNEQ